MFLRRVPASQCVQIFTELTEEVFRRSWGSIFFRARQLFKLLVRDSFYDPYRFELALRRTLGSKRMFDYHSGNSTKVGVTIAPSHGLKTVILANYNPQPNAKPNRGKVKDSCLTISVDFTDATAYEIVRDADIEREPRIWEA